MNEHCAKKDAKCKKCKKSFEICQAGYHGLAEHEPEGWRICFLPCNCGFDYYPDKARAAKPLQAHEYRPDHPGYRALEQTDDTELEHYLNFTEQPGEGSTISEYYSHVDGPSAPPASGPTYVELSVSGGLFGFYDEQNKERWTNESDWRLATILYQEVEVPCFQFDDYDGTSYFTWKLGTRQPKVSTKALGKQTGRASSSRKGGSSTSHQRTLSEESDDPLQWDNKRYEEETITSKMAELGVGEASSSRQGEDNQGKSAKFVRVSARLTKKGKVRFTLASKEEYETKRENWVATEGGYVFDSKPAGCVFFAKEIKPAKK
jgi:hypothetical protein